MIKRIATLIQNGLMYSFFRLKHSFRYLGWPVVFNSGVEIENASTLYIGNFSNIGKDTWIRSSLPGKGPGISLGINSMIGRRNFISCAKEITIGNNCIFGPNVTIVDSNHVYTDPAKPISTQGITEPVPVYIGDDCWIGTNAVVLPGTTLGDHCVVGANSVVSGNIPSYSVITGIPGKIVKKYDTKSEKWKKTNLK